MPETGNALRLEIGQRSDVGKIRRENEDSSTSGFSINADLLRERGRLFVVADGMGGERGGSLASGIAIGTIKEHYYLAEISDARAALDEAIREANRQIRNHATADEGLKRMGTTCSALVVHRDSAFFGHVGDSRIYLLRDDKLQQLTEDHSVVFALVKAGLITEAQAARHPARHQITKALGSSDEVEPDISDAMPLQEGDVFVLCSDGLHGVVSEDEIAAAARKPPSEAADALIEIALSRGAPDNVTVIVVRMVRPS